MRKISSNEWSKAQEFERKWWGDCSNTYDEEQKQLQYATLMGLDKYKEASKTSGQSTQFNLKGKTILDIGGGPISLLLKCVNFKRAVVVDSCKFPDWVLRRYEAHGIEFVNKLAEDIDFQGFDEVWIYNVLQHVIDPERVMKRAKQAGDIVRIFEWIDTGTDVAHPNNLTSEMLDKYFDGSLREMNENGCHGRAYIDIYEAEERVAEARRKQKRFHLLGLAHLATNKNEAIACAYSQKVLKLGRMLKSSGHKVFFYGVEGSIVECDEFIQVSTKEILKRTYGDYDYKKVQYKFDVNDLAYNTFDENAIREINKRKQEGDFLLVPFGLGEKKISDAVRIHLTVESGIGYDATFTNFRVFESYAWMHYVYGLQKVEDGKSYDCVIPNYFDPEDFKFSSKKRDYFLYLGRLVKRKGIEEAKETVKAIGGRLILAGQRREGVPADFIDTSPSYMNYVGFADFKKRRKLLSEAKALFVPTEYIGPFEGVSIEAAFSGTPVITTDHGCFAENVQHGVTGYRCHTLDHFIWAAKNIDKIDPQKCRDFAMKNFTMERVAKMYDEYFDQLQGLSRKGWYLKNPERNQLDWLNKYYV